MKKEGEAPLRFLVERRLSHTSAKERKKKIVPICSRKKTHRVERRESICSQKEKRGSRERSPPQTGGRNGGSNSPFSSKRKRDRSQQRMREGGPALQKEKEITPDISTALCSLPRSSRARIIQREKEEKERM